MVQVTLLYTAPTAIRSLQSFGNKFVTKNSRKSLRILGTVGEPINPEAWKWYHEVRQFSRCLPIFRSVTCSKSDQTTLYAPQGAKCLAAGTLDAPKAPVLHKIRLCMMEVA